MDYIVYVFWRDKDGPHEEYRQHLTKDEAVHWADHKVEKLKSLCESGHYDGFSIMLYERIGY